jgi:hypothetical protein
VGRLPEGLSRRRGEPPFFSGGAPPPRERAAHLRASIELGVPLSILLGRSWTPGEPWFLEDDLAAVLDYFDYLDSLCPGCGQPKSESFDKTNTFAYRAHTHQCHACAARRRAEERLDDRFGVYSSAERVRR